MNSIKTILSMIESKAIDDGLKSCSNISRTYNKNQGEVMRSEFEEVYEPNPHKSPFTEVRFNEEKQVYEPLNPPLDWVARSLNAAWYGYRIRQGQVESLNNQLKESRKVANKAIQMLRGARANPESLYETSQAAFYNQLKELEQALKGGGE